MNQALISRSRSPLRAALTIARRWYGSACKRFARGLRQAERAPLKISRLDKSIQADRKIPHTQAERIADIHAFVTHPPGYGESVTDSRWAPRILAGPHIVHALHAQRYTFEDEPEHAAKKMQEARKLIECWESDCRSVGKQDLPLVRHWQLLAALARSFERGEALRAGQAPEIPLSSDSATPLLPYLEERRAALLAYRGKYADAFAALARAKAINVSLDPAEEAAHASQIANLALAAERANDTQWKSILDAAETRFLDRTVDRLMETLGLKSPGTETTSLREDNSPEEGQRKEAPPENNLSEDDKTKLRKELKNLHGWQHRVDQARLKRASEIKEVDRIVAKAKERFNSWRKLKVDPKTVFWPEKEISQLEENIAKQAEIQKANLGNLKTVSLKTVSMPVADASEAHSYAAQHLSRSRRLTWRGLAKGIKSLELSEPTVLFQDAARSLTNARGAAEWPPASPYRLVLQIPENLKSSDKTVEDAAHRLIGQPEDKRPSLEWIRKQLGDHLGIRLPPVQVLLTPDAEEWAVVLLDNRPLAYKHWSEHDRYWSDLSEKSSSMYWPLPKLVPENKSEKDIEPLDIVQYLALWFGHQVLTVLPDLVDPAMVEHLVGLRGKHPAIQPQQMLDATLPLLRLLLTDRTPLVERDALGELGADIAAGRLTALQAAEAYRQMPAIRGSLWGVDGQQLKGFSLNVKIEQDLVSCIKNERTQFAITVSDTLIQEIRQKISDEITEQRTKAKVPNQTEPLFQVGRNAAQLQIQEPARLCLVVSEPALRPWLSALLRQLGQTDIPVVTERELLS